MPMEDFVVSARKYRPLSFDTVVGQESITQTLLKAIENNHLAQAFLFCGPRGVGKTSCARILARTVNEFHAEPGNNGDDFAFNIFELDAASNNSVDDIRNLIEQTRIPPQIGKYKVYIIDEVHMLSAQAFNAFLKTLEEPPPYAIFILATTEKHKVLPTIISRCQVFDFNRIQIPEMVAHLSRIAQKEGIEAENDALHIIAEKADGALRDALSIFDQVAGFTGKNMSYQDVISNLNILDYDYYFEMTDAFLRGDKSQALVTFNTILNNGFDGHNFTNGLANHFRNLLFCTSERTAAIMEVGANIQKRYLEQAKNCDTRFILNGLNILSDTDIHFKASKNQRLIVELALLKLCNLSDQLAQKKNADYEVEPFGKGEDAVSAKVEVKKEPIQDEKSKDVSSLPENSGLVSEPEPAKIVKSNPDISEKNSIENQEIESVESTFSEKVSTTTETAVDAETTEDITESSFPEKESTTTETADAKEEISAPVTNSGIEEITNERKTEPRIAEQPEKEITPRKFQSRLSGAKSKGLPSLSSLAEESKLINRKPGSSIAETAEEILARLNENKPSTDFNLAELWKVWDEYAEKIKGEDKKSYYATLTKNQPVLREKFKVELLLDNHVQLSDLDADKLQLLEFLREKLNNWRIQLEGIIDDTETEDGDSLYDPRKKFEAMNAQNPTLAKMKEIFDLDVEHDG